MRILLAVAFLLSLAGCGTKEPDYTAPAPVSTPKVVQDTTTDKDHGDHGKDSTHVDKGHEKGHKK